MPFRFGLRRSKASQSAGHHSGGARQVAAHDPGSLESGLNDALHEHDGVGGQANRAVIQPSTAHGAAPTVAVESRPSLFRRTISSLSLRGTPKASNSSGLGSGKVEAQANGNRAGESPEGRKQTDANVSGETDNAKKGAALHNLLPRLHNQLHHQHVQASPASGHDSSAETVQQSSHLPLHLPHLHLPHLLEGKSHANAPHDVLSGVENSAEIMKVLQDATTQAKKIIEAAMGERENLLGRARAEAEEEMNSLRLALEQEDVARQNEDVDDDKALLSATAKEEELMRQYREASEKNMAASVTLCVEYVLNVDTSIAAERRDALRNLKANPPNFFLKSQAHNYPSVRNSNRCSKRSRNVNLSSHPWDIDFTDYPPAGAGESSIYSAILGDRTYDDDEFQIDFDELERPSPIQRLSTAIQNIQTSCGCFM